MSGLCLGACLLSIELGLTPCGRDSRKKNHTRLTPEGGESRVDACVDLGSCNTVVFHEGEEEAMWKGPVLVVVTVYILVVSDSRSA